MDIVACTGTRYLWFTHDSGQDWSHLKVPRALIVLTPRGQSAALSAPQTAPIFPTKLHYNRSSTWWKANKGEENENISLWADWQRRWAGTGEWGMLTFPPFSPFVSPRWLTGQIAISRDISPPLNPPEPPCQTLICRLTDWLNDWLND